VRNASRVSLEALLEGLMASDGSTSATGKQVYTTTSAILAGQLQEIALKIGRAATIHTRTTHDDVHFGSKPVHYVTIFRPRRMRPKIGWTTTRRVAEVQRVHYTGEVHCVTVPNGTLYVRRNGKPIWSGNSPFEHNSMTFYVQAPIFVFREFMRHRIASYNEESGRYRELRPVFYVPGPQRRLRQVGKPGAYEFLEGTPEQSELVRAETERVCREAFASYQRMLEAGVAREVARIVLPLTIYSSMYVTMNARSLMNFLSLRTAREGARFPSFPQREIEMCAERMEEHWAGLMPLTHAAFEANGRVGP
jgi:thymidylate synthase (FAD)